MNITWEGESYIKIEAKNQKGEDIKILIDPPKDNFSKLIQKENPQVIIFTLPLENLNLNETKGLFLIQEPGEYEVKGVFVNLIFVKEKSFFAKILSEDIKVCHLNSFDQKELPEDVIETLGGIDVLIISLEKLEPKEASNIVSQLEPKIAIPIGYSEKDETTLKEFLKQRGIKKEIEKIDKFKIKANQLPQEEDYETQLVILKQ
jgi:hypothetical protein